MTHRILQANVDYLLTARIKVDKLGMDGRNMPCKNTTNTWNDCPRWSRKIMLKMVVIDLNQGTIGKYGECCTFANVWRCSIEDIGGNVAGNIFVLENNESGTIVSVDELAIDLP
ncbi:hypothetical protein ACHAW6_012932 [Cyclotella cf. meneghiniana]